MKKFILILSILLIIGFASGCAFDSDADIASHNVSKEADQFRVKRRIVFINLRSDSYLFSITGNCSINNNLNNELEVICKVGDKYDYEIIFKPESIIPIKTQTE